MKDADTKTIALFAGRSDRSVMWIASFFAIGGALLDMGAHGFGALFAKGGGLSAMWGAWIPLCFLTIPPIHYLCRRVRDLEARLDALARTRDPENDDQPPSGDERRAS
jgi:hypothetical protein